jgi:hypothetical protein
MISDKLQQLADLAIQIEALLPGTTTYQIMYTALELDLDIALKNVANNLVSKFNIPVPMDEQIDIIRNQTLLPMLCSCGKGDCAPGYLLCPQCIQQYEEPNDPSD